MTRSSAASRRSRTCISTNENWTSKSLIMSHSLSGVCALLVRLLIELFSLKRLQEKLAKQRAYLEELDAHVGEMVERKTQATAEESAKK